MSKDRDPKKVADGIVASLVKKIERVSPGQNVVGPPLVQGKSKIEPTRGKQ